jgi:hypothetical protein
MGWRWWWVWAVLYAAGKQHQASNKVLTIEMGTNILCIQFTIQPQADKPYGGTLCPTVSGDHPFSGTLLQQDNTLPRLMLLLHVN